MRKSDTERVISENILDHEMLCTLALVNKKWYSAVLKTAMPRRKYLEHCASDTLTSFHVCWHKYGSAYAYWKCDIPFKGDVDFVNDKFNLYFYLIFVRGRNKTLGKHTVQCYPARFYENPLFTESRPFFKGPKKVGFYALGWSSSFLYDDKRYLVEYSLDIYGKKKKLRCFSQVTHFDNINHILSMDYHAKAQSLWPLLQSRGVIKEDAMQKVYGVGGITWRDRCFENISEESASQLR